MVSHWTWRTSFPLEKQDLLACPVRWNPRHTFGRNGQGERKQRNWAEELPKFVAGDMYFVRFGPRAGDPMWAVDLLSSQTDKEQESLEYLLADARDGFPIPFYPRCLQKADEYAQVVDLDLAILQEEVFASLRGNLSGIEQSSLDGFRFKPDFTGRRYD